MLYTEAIKNMAATAGHNAPLGYAILPISFEIKAIRMIGYTHLNKCA